MLAKSEFVVLLVSRLSFPDKKCFTAKVMSVVVGWPYPVADGRVLYDDDPWLEVKRVDNRVCLGHNSEE